MAGGGIKIRGFGRSAVVVIVGVISLFLPAEANDEAAHQKTGECEDGLLFPVWLPQEGLSLGDRFARGLAYFLGMLYMFIGVSIISDRFMASIEVITSKEKEIKVKRPNGDVQIVVVRVWNETVANLTLMALGSSAPEILLSIIEIFGKGFDAGDLGPGTIVGSAAFNLFVIIAICVYVIPPGEIRRIKHLRVFFVTATWSVFAYIWLLVILKVTSPDRVDVWEGVLTFIFFPLTVGSAYIADRRLLIYKYLSKSYRVNKHGVVVEGEGGGSMTELGRLSSDGLRVFEEEDQSEEVREFEQSRRDYIQLLKDLRKRHPTAEADQLEAMAREEILNKGPKSRAFYRMQATRKLMGGQNLMKKVQERAASEQSSNEALGTAEVEEVKVRDEHITRVYFDPGHYTVMENVGQFQVAVTREGGDLGLTVLVDYKTEDGTASAEADYIPLQGTLKFHPEERHKQITLEVLDDDVFEEDEHFYIRLSHARFSGTVQSNGIPGRTAKAPEVELVSPFLATVMILDDDHCGIFNITDKNIETVESIGLCEVKVSRWSGARGRVGVPYTTIEGTAKAGKDYVHVEGELIFENNETEKTIQVQILEEDSYEKDVLFYVEIAEPHPFDDLDAKGKAFAESMKEKNKDYSRAERIAMEGWPKLGNDTRSMIRVKESKEFKNTVDKLLQRANASLHVGTNSWKEQFLEAITVNGGDDDDGGDEESRVPSCGDYVMHFLTIFWKLIFAFVPPTSIAGGYIAFVISIMAIGICTAIIGDLAGHFGCSFGLKDSVTAIIFVALGTSIPGIYDGYVTFVVSILGIGALTAVIGDLASHLGCTIGLKDSITAIAFVALGTSVPDTFASKVAAIQDEFADASVGNVTGSNAVNVFLGIGIAWTIAAVYHTYFKPSNEVLCVQGTTGNTNTDKKTWVYTHCPYFHVDPGSLAYSVTLFCACACVAIAIMLLRRLQAFGGGELGGPARFKYPTAILFVCLWIFYVVMSSLEAYGVIKGF